MTSTSPEAIVRDIQAWSAARTIADRLELERLLEHRSPVVRSASALALARGTTRGERALITALPRERSELVLADICDAIAELGSSRALPQLRRLARTHRSQLARTYAVRAVARIAGRSALPFLLRLRSRDPSRRVRATIDVERACLRVPGAVVDLLRHLESADYIVRIRVVKGVMCREATSAERVAIVSAFRVSLKAEESLAVRGQLRSALVRLRRGSQR